MSHDVSRLACRVLLAGGAMQDELKALKTQVSAQSAVDVLENIERQLQALISAASSAVEGGETQVEAGS